MKQPQKLTLQQILDLAKEGKTGLLIRTPVGFRRVKTVYDNGWLPTVEISTQDYKTVTTPEHSFSLVDGTLKQAQDLAAGDILQTVKGPQPFIERKLTGVQHVGDVEVETPEHLIFSDGLLQHNCISGVMSQCVELSARITIRLEVGEFSPNIHNKNGLIEYQGQPYTLPLGAKQEHLVTLRETLLLAKRNVAFSVLTDTGFELVQGVKHAKVKKWYEIWVNTKDGTKIIQVTKDHGFYTPDYKKVSAQSLKPDDYIVCKWGEAKVREVNQVDYMDVGHALEVGDLSVRGKNHRFYANDILVANCVECLDMDETLIEVVIQEGQAPEVVDNREHSGNY